MDSDFLLEVLACPKCHGQFELIENRAGETGFACKNCSVVYPVENDIPVMLVEKSIPQNEFMREEA